MPAFASTPSGQRIPQASTAQRVWARDRLKGLLNLFLPSFREDQRTLDEGAIRHDVRHAVAQGFSGTMPMVNWTPPGDPRWEQFLRIVLDEAGNALPVHASLFGRTPADDLPMIRRLEDMGVALFLLANTHRPDIAENALFDSLRARIEATTLPVMLYAALGKGRAFAHLGPAGQPLEVYDRLADLPNLVAVKVSQPVTLTSTLQLCDRLGDRLLMGPVNLDFVPLLSRHHHIQWSGQWNGEAVQTPADPLGNRLLEACAAGDTAAVDATMRRIQPALDHFFGVQAAVIRSGAHPWQHNKFYSWLGGGNGGLLPADAHAPAGAVPVLDQAARDAMRAAFRASGLEPTDAPDEQFVVGRAAWARGVRPGDLPALPSYAA